MNGNAIFQDLFEEQYYDQDIVVGAGAPGEPPVSNAQTTTSAAYHGSIPNAPISNVAPSEAISLGVSQMLSSMTNKLSQYKSDSSSVLGMLLPQIAAIGLIGANITNDILRGLFILLASIMTFDMDMIITMSCFIYLVFSARYTSALNTFIIMACMLHMILFYSFNTIIQYSSMISWIFGVLICIIMMISLLMNSMAITSIREMAGQVEQQDNNYVDPDDNPLITGGMDLLNYRID